jgi:inner membrane protein|tara:strand:- start:1710 stop:2171 length:462 start_codon:yes stop_codon:yes gene_type:complete
MFKTHLAFGVLIGLIVLNIFTFENKILFSIFLIIGAILPDIDIMTSKVGSKFRPLSWFLGMLFGHRGLIHTIYVPILVFILLTLFGYSLLGYGFLIGYLSHLIIDALNIKGVSFFKPLIKLHIRGFIKSGGILEYLLLSIIVILIIFMVSVIR